MDQTDFAAASAAPLVGREREWQRLMEPCRRLAQGHGGLLCLSGEAGIGKTALLERLDSCVAARGWRPLWGRHFDQPLTPPLDGLRQALGRLLRLELRLDEEPLAAHLRAGLAARWPELLVHSRDLAEWLSPDGHPEQSLAAGTPGARARGRLFHQLHSLLRVASREQVLVLLQDNLQWADGLTFEALAHLASLLRELPVLVVLAYRPEEMAPVQPQLHQLAQQDGVLFASVSRLDVTAVAEMVRRRLGAPPTDLAARLHRLTEGVPLFVEQYLEGYGAERAQLAAGSLERLPLPTRIQALLARRVAPLEPELRQLLDLAAVAGEPFAADVLAQVAGRTPEQVLGDLARLEEEHRLVRRSEDLPPAGGRFAFHHPLVARWVYDALPEAGRQLLHRALAAALEPLVPGQPDQVFAVARHLQGGGQPGQAVEALLAAGRRAAALHGGQQAAGCFRRALEICPAADRLHQAELHEALGDVLAADGSRGDEPYTHYERSLEAQDDAERRGVLWRKLGEARRGNEWLWRCLQQGLRETEQCPHGEARYQLWLALIQAPLSDRATNVLAARQALAILRLRPTALAWADMLISHLPWVHGRRLLRLGRQRRLLRRGIRLAQAAEAWHLVIQGRLRLAETWRGVDLEAAIAEAEGAALLAERYLPPGTGSLDRILVCLLGLYLAAGRREQALSLRRRISSGATDVLLVAAGGQLVTAEDRWDRLSLKVRAGFARGRYAHGTGYELLSRWQLLALEQGREAQMRGALAALMQEHPQAGAPPLLGPPQAVPEPVPGSGVQLRLDELRWDPVSPHDRVRWLSADEPELTPGPEVGLGWLRLVPRLVAAQDGDFAIAVTLAASGHPQRAGGLLVRQGDAYLRLGSGIDHVGQVSLGHTEGSRFVCDGTGGLEASEVHLRMERRGCRYSAQVSGDGRQWHAWPAVDFGLPGPVEVGLFAECSYHFRFPQPFPVRFRGFSLRALARPAPARPAERLWDLPREIPRFQGMVGQSAVFQDFCRQLTQVVDSPYPLLVCGDTGTGKELAVRAVHRLSRRRDRPFIAFSIAGLPASLLESELFGHVRGAFTGADRTRTGLIGMADGGTLFMDEIGELPLPLQAKLLRSISEGEIVPLGSSRVHKVDVRCLAATLQDLERLVALGEFRADLYYRLGQPLQVPPLRERRDDIPYLVAHFIASQADEPTSVRVTRRAMDRLCEYDWPGNVRQLEYLVERAVRSAEGGLLTEAELGPPAAASDVSTAAPSRSAAIPGQQQASAIPATRPQAAARPQPPLLPRPASPVALAALLQECDLNLTEAARRCGVTRQTVYRWLRADGLDVTSLRRGPAS